MGQQQSTGWMSGPLPSQLEQIALKVFSRQYPMAAWSDPVFSAERNDARRFVLHVREDFQALDAWTIEDAHERLTDRMLPLAFGARRIGPTLRQEVVDYCECFIADFWGALGRRLIFPAEIEKNTRDCEREDARGRR